MILATRRAVLDRPPVLQGSIRLAPQERGDLELILVD
jgi:hypothetical protein